MDLGMIGLGRMGSNMVRRLLEGGHNLTIYDPKTEAVEILVRMGAAGTTSITNLSNRLEAPRAIWVMVPSGETTEITLNTLVDELFPGDTVIDGGNSNYKDSIRRASALATKGISMLDVGTSGGIWGLKDGYSLTVGGDKATFERLKPIFQTLSTAVDRGYGYVGRSGAGHFVKMVHNGIEYGLMEAYAEGFELLNAKDEFGLDLHQVAEIWRHGSVVRSWLLDLISGALKDNPDLEGINAYVEDSGEGRWAVHEAIDLDVPLPVISQALQARFRSRQEQPLTARLLAIIRQQFGGHAVKKKG